ncbi:MAG: PSD1 and planctomycete cytochrome C domain-containing protein [Pirellulaceae bacterium]
MQTFMRLIAMNIACSCWLTWAVADDGTAYFEQHIRPVLVEHCYECHSNGAGKAEGGLRLDTQSSMLEGGDSGPSLVPGMPAESMIMDALNYESVEMPPSGKLDAATIAKFENWISSGAADPRTEDSGMPKKPSIDWEQAENYWAFQPADDVRVPTVENAWATSPLDQFIYARLAEEDLSPAPEASRSTWLRRVSFDLIGLPPTPQQLDDFLSDPRDDAYELVVDRLLRSPHYGERWGRHWLDLARYADTNGADENHKYPESWRYRDYVVEAFNSDTPYDRFIHEQLAGDLLPARSEAERRKLLTATGFLVIGPKMLAEQDKDKLVADIVDEQLDTVGKVFLGLTLGCARCHDHKFDPITAADYYALAGIFHSTQTMEHLDHVSQWSERVLPDAVSAQLLNDFEQHFAQQQAEVQALRIQARQQEKLVLAERLKSLWMSRLAIDDESLDSSIADDESNVSLRLVLDSEALTPWVQLSQLPESEFAKAVEERFDPNTNAESNQTESATKDWVFNVIGQRPPETALELIDVVVAALSQRWLALATELGENEKADKKIQTAERMLFGKDAPLDVTREPGQFLPSNVREELAARVKQFKELEKQRPSVAKAMAVDEAKQVKLVAVHVRGNHLQFAGDPLPRRVPKILSEQHIGQLPSPAFPEGGSGRLQFAQWLTHPDHPLTARVMVNRIWQGHFGEGLVASPSNFGLRGDLPSHPQLLDWLAAEFQRQGWSIKAMHRMIVLSSTYRMAWINNPESEEIDPENRLLWRQNRRRLEAEPIRDALLAIGGRLDHEIGGAWEAASGKYVDSGASWSDLDSPRRTLHLPINRAALDDFFSTFDYVDPAASLEKRPATIVPHQTLFLMNHPLSMHAGWALAQRVTSATQSPVDRVRMAYANVYGRYPNDDEIRRAREFIEQAETPSLWTRGALVNVAGTSDNGPNSDDKFQDAEVDAWVRYCRSLLLANEFLYID